MNYILQHNFMKTQRGMMRKLKNDFWTITGEFIYRFHVVPSKRLNAKEVIFSPKMESSYFQSQMDESKPLEENQDLRTSTLKRDLMQYSLNKDLQHLK